MFIHLHYAQHLRRSRNDVYNEFTYGDLTWTDSVNAVCSWRVRVPSVTQLSCGRLVNHTHPCRFGCLSHRVRLYVAWSVVGLSIHDKCVLSGINEGETPHISSSRGMGAATLETCTAPTMLANGDTKLAKRRRWTSEHFFPRDLHLPYQSEGEMLAERRAEFYFTGCSRVTFILALVAINTMLLVLTWTEWLG